MVKIVGKIELDNDKERKLNTFRNRLIEIISKSKNNILPLGKVLHEADLAKAYIKKNFKEYIIDQEDRKSQNDNFNWIRFFDENLSPEFEIEPNHAWGNGQISDAIYYRPQQSKQVNTNLIQNIATINTEMAKKKKQKIDSQSYTKNAETSTQQIEINSMSEAQTSTIEQNTETKIQPQDEQPVVPNNVAPTIIENNPTKMTQEEINELLKQLLTQLNEGLYEKERSIRLTLLAVLAGESTFMLGEPGTAKSLVARRISEAFEDAKGDGEIKFFDYLMNQFSTPEEIFGPVSINELKNDKYIRKIDNYLPKAQFAFLDEIWKANPAIQNALLTILNEKIYRNGAQVEKVPLIGFMSASNELPEKSKGLEAIFDRFLVRILEKPIANNDNFRSMISADRKMAATITRKLEKSIIEKILEESEIVEISDECFNIIDSVRKSLTKRNSEITDENEKYLVSDRRWKKIANLMRVSAYCNNREKTDIMDATLIADCIWSTEKQEEDAKRIVADAIKAYGVSCKSNLKDLQNKVNKFKEDVNENFYEEVRMDGEYKTKNIGGITYYEVQSISNKNDTCYISQIAYESSNYNNYGYNYRNTRKMIFYKNSKREEIDADFDDASMTYTLSSNGTKYKVIENQPTSQKREMAEHTKKATIDWFNQMGSKINSDIINAIKGIDRDVNELKSQFSSNLFANSELYSNIVFKEQINAKAELDKLSKELAEQRKRYQ